MWVLLAFVMPDSPARAPAMLIHHRYAKPPPQVVVLPRAECVWDGIGLQCLRGWLYKNGLGDAKGSTS